MEQAKTFSDIKFEVKGADMQYVEVILQPGQAVIAQPGTMMFMESGIQMSTSLTDGSDKHSGMIGTIAGMGRRYMAGEDLFVTFYTNNDNKEHLVAFAGPYQGKIQDVDLNSCGGEILCQRGSFLCSAKGTSIGVGYTKKLSVGLFGGEGFVLQKLNGTGTVFIHSCGSMEELTLAKGQVIYVDTGSLVGFQKGVEFDIQAVKGLKNMMFGGENLFLTKLTGPGRVWIQSMPYSKLIGQISYSVMQAIADKK